MKLFPITVLAALACAGCASTLPPPVPVAPPLPAAFKEADPRWVMAAPAEARPRGAWWKAFSDPVLDGLIDRAERSNSAIHLAAARLAQARALVRSADAARAPQLGLNASASRQGGPLINAAGADGTLLSASASFSYEIDLIGRLAKTADAARLDAGAGAAMLQNARLLVQAEAADTYFGLRALDAERTIVRRIQAAYRDQLGLVERRAGAGYGAEFDVQLLRAEAAAADADALLLDRRRAELEHALAVLAGELATTFSVAEAVWDTPLPAIPAGLPSTLLTRRPDVSAAQRGMMAEQARANAARLAWFPNLILTSAFGHASADLGELLHAATRAWSVGSLLALPLLDGGRRDAALQRADAQLQAAAASYRERILVAFRDSEDQLSSLRLLADLRQVQGTALAASERASLLAESRYRSGLSSQLDLIVVRRDALRLRRQALHTRLAQFQATVGLFRALGGDWDGGDAAGDRPRLAGS
jgi:multidrug efflux system outer membrane protein